jgi:hypothetical protein
MNSLWRFLSLGGALVIVVVAAIWVAVVYLFPPVPKSPAPTPPEQKSFNVRDAVAPLAPTAAAPILPSQDSTTRKTVQVCQEEWRAMRAAGQRTTTEKAYIAQCRAGDATVVQIAPITTTAPMPLEAGVQKTVEACQEKWRAMRAAGQRTTAEKAYVAQCRSAATAISPAVTGLSDSPSGSADSVPAPAVSPVDTARPRRRSDRIIQW